MKKNIYNSWLMIFLFLFLIPLACSLLGRQETTPVPVAPVTSQPPAITASDTPTATLMDETPTDSVVTGNILIEGGNSAMGGYAGDMIQASITYTATSQVAPVTEMRTAKGCGEETLQDAVWEPFVTQKSFPLIVSLNWVGFGMSVQYRDAQGNLSPVYCDDINVEGMSKPPTSPP